MRFEWIQITAANITDIVGLAQRCVRHDGGLAMTASKSFIERRYTGAGVETVGALENGRLVACGAVRDLPEGCGAVGLVEPTRRGRGLGSELLDRMLATAGRRSEHVRVETESLTPEADALFTCRGLRPTFAEDVFRRDLSTPFPPAPFPEGVEVRTWQKSTMADFYDAYRASFSDRPGFPNWSRQQWTDWLADDEFQPESSLVARTTDGAAIGFVACAQDFLIQVGSVPKWRHRGLGRALATDALERMRSAGGTEVFLDVNVDNPASAGLFLGLGFTVIARRARYEPR